MPGHGARPAVPWIPCAHHSSRPLGDHASTNRAQGWPRCTAASALQSLTRPCMKGACCAAGRRGLLRRVQAALQRAGVLPVPQPHRGSFLLRPGPGLRAVRAPLQLSGWSVLVSVQPSAVQAACPSTKLAWRQSLPAHRAGLAVLTGWPPLSLGRLAALVPPGQPQNAAAASLAMPWNCRLRPDSRPSMRSWARCLRPPWSQASAPAGWVPCLCAGLVSQAVARCWACHVSDSRRSAGVRRPWTWSPPSRRPTGACCSCCPAGKAACCASRTRSASRCASMVGWAAQEDPDAVVRGRAMHPCKP